MGEGKVVTGGGTGAEADAVELAGADVVTGADVVMGAGVVTGASVVTGMGGGTGASVVTGMGGGTGASVGIGSVEDATSVDEDTVVSRGFGVVIPALEHKQTTDPSVDRLEY